MCLFPDTLPSYEGDHIKRLGLVNNNMSDFCVAVGFFLDCGTVCATEFNWIK